MIETINSDQMIPSASELADLMRQLKKPSQRHEEIQGIIHYTDGEIMRGAKDKEIVGGRPLNLIRTVKLKAVEFASPSGKTQLHWIYEGRVHL